MGTTTSSSGPVTILDKPEPITLPAFDKWPWFTAPKWLRNGREAGAWFAGVVSCIPEKCARVSMPEDWVGGATYSMIDGGLIVQSFSYGDDGERTLEVRSANHEFVDAAS